MAYKQKSKDISGLMMKMKSPLNYGGRSAMMKTGDPEKFENPNTGQQYTKPSKPDISNFKYKGVNYSMGKGGQINMPGGKSWFKNDMHYGKIQKKYSDAYQMAMGDYSTKLDAYNKAQSASKVKTRPAASIKLPK
jgi:hypothetical protein